MRPFAKTPDPSAMYLSPSHEEAMARMLQAVEERELCIIAGEIGSGKTTVVRAVLDALDDSVIPIVIVNPTIGKIDMLRQIAVGLGIESPAYRHGDIQQQIFERMYTLDEDGLLPLLIIDEAHLLKMPDGFEQIRLLTNFQLDDRNLLSVLLVGQPELRDILADPRIAALRQRVGYTYFLPALASEEVQEYVRRRWTNAGGAFEIFDDDCWQVAYENTDGIPRRINQLMHNACMGAFARDSAVVSAADVSDAAQELWQWT